MVNLTIEAIIIFFASLVTLVSSILLYRQYRVSPDLVIGALSLSWFFYALTQFSIALGVFLLNPVIYGLNPILFCFLALTAQVVFDLINRAEIVFWHVAGISIVVGALFISAIFFNDVDPAILSNGDKSLLVTGTTRNLVLLMAGIVVIQNFAYAVKIYRHAHTDFMDHKRNILIGNFLFGPGAFIAYFFQPYIRIPGIIDLTIALGVLLSTYSILKAPQLLFVLPFKAIQLVVIEAGTGISLFSYRWTGSDQLVSDTMLTSVIEALNMFVAEHVNLGLIRDINLREGNIILSPIDGTNKYVALISTKLTLSLKIGIEKFTKEFRRRFETDLKKGNIYETTTFQQATSLIDTCFPYTPKHRSN